MLLAAAFPELLLESEGTALEPAGLDDEVRPEILLLDPAALLELVRPEEDAELAPRLVSLDTEGIDEDMMSGLGIGVEREVLPSVALLIAAEEGTLEVVGDIKGLLFALDDATLPIVEPDETMGLADRLVDTGTMLLEAGGMYELDPDVRIPEAGDTDELEPEV